jgi:hypothetical protein
MKDVLLFLQNLPGIPIEYVLAIIAMAAIFLAAFTLYVVHSLLSKEKPE